jgi:hypothetical protein
VEHRPHPSLGQIDLIQTKALGKGAQRTELGIGHESGPTAMKEEKK